MVNKPEDSVLPSDFSVPVPVPVARAGFRVGGAGMPFEDLQCKQV